MTAASYITGSPITTLAVPDQAAVEAAYRDTLGFRRVGAYPLTPALAALWGVRPFPAGAGAVLLAAPGSQRGWLRLVPGTGGPNRESFGARGWIASESLTQDVEALYRRLQDSPFRPLASPQNFDLTHLDSVLARSVTARGPAGEGMFFTQVMTQPAGRVLEAGGAAVGPLFNAVLSAGDMAAARRLYQDVLGMQLIVEGVLHDAGVNRLLGFPPATAFPFATVRGRGDGNVELHVYPAEMSYARSEPPDVLPPGTALYTLATDQIATLRAHVAEAGYRILGSAEGLPEPPYKGGAAFTLQGPFGERLEIVEGEAG